MLIGLLSDTHIPDAVMALPTQVKDAFHGVELILHAGDIFVVSVLDELEDTAPVLAAVGDSDYLETRQDKRVEDKHVLNLEGVTIRLCHDERSDWDEQKELPDIIVCGHTHWPLVKREGEVLIVNPGSATYPNYQCRLGTVGLLTIEDGKVEARIIQLQ